MSTHSATQDLTPNTSRFDAWRKITHSGLRQPNRPAASKAAQMNAEGQNTGSIAFPENRKIAAGYTFLGQLLAHDITMARNLGITVPQLRLLSLYGAGPSAMTGAFAHYPDDFDDPAMWARHIKQSDQYELFQHAKFKLKHEGADQYDVPRLNNGIAIMADNRNDQHVILCQLHCAFARFHNALAEWLQYLNYPYMLMDPDGTPMKGQQLFTLAREIAVWCYQRVLVEDYLPQILYSPDLIQELRGANAKFKFFDETKAPQLMPEFSLAAMRIGHSQTKEVYRVNRADDRLSILSNRKDVKNLGGFQKHDPLNFEWDAFFKLGDTPPQASASIDHWVSQPLSKMPFRPKNDNNLPAINLRRSEMLPAGEALAEKAGFPPLPVPTDSGFESTGIPLWLYILLEAELTQKGEKLGAFGSQLIAEQIMWVLRHDPMSPYSGPETFNALDQFVGELFRIYDLDNFLGAPEVLTQGLELLGMNNPGLDMPWLIRFPKRVAQQIANLGNALEAFGQTPQARKTAVSAVGKQQTEAVKGPVEFMRNLLGGDVSNV